MIRKTLLSATAALCLAAPARAGTYDESLAGLVATTFYVSQHCPEMRPNQAAIHEHLEALGASSDQEIPKGITAAAAGLVRRMETERPRVMCARIWSQFGSGGAALPDTFLHGR